MSLIFELMQKCNCAVINISADEQQKREDETYGINANVLIEIGGAFLAYDENVILLCDKRVLPLPSNLDGLYRCEYEGDELSADNFIKLLEALGNFKKKKGK